MIDASIWFLVVAFGVVITIAIICARLSGEVDEDREHLDWKGRC